MFQKLYLQKHDKATVEQCTGCPYKYLHAQPSYYQTDAMLELFPPQLQSTCQTQLSTTLWDRRLRFLVVSQGTTVEWIIHVLFDPLFLDCHAIGNDLPVVHDELGFVRLNRIAATQHRLGVSFATGSWLWSVEADCGNGYAPGWDMLLMMMN